MEVPCDSVAREDACTVGDGIRPRPCEARPSDRDEALRVRPRATSTSAVPRCAPPPGSGRRPMRAASASRRKSRRRSTASQLPGWRARPHTSPQCRCTSRGRHRGGTGAGRRRRAPSPADRAGARRVVKHLDESEADRGIERRRRQREEVGHAAATSYSTGEPWSDHARREAKPLTRANARSRSPGSRGSR